MCSEKTVFFFSCFFELNLRHMAKVGGATFRKRQKKRAFFPTSSDELHDKKAAVLILNHVVDVDYIGMPKIESNTEIWGEWGVTYGGNGYI